MLSNANPSAAEPRNRAALDGAIDSRISARAFTAQAVGREQIEQVLLDATCDSMGAAPPPCEVHVLRGRSRDRLCDAVCALHGALRIDPGLQAMYREPYDYYPAEWFSPYIERRRENGWGLYGLLGIGKADKDMMHAQHQRNYRYFDAPVGLVFTTGRARGAEHLLACGRFLQSVMLHARLQGLHTCPQAAWNRFSCVVLPHVGAAADQVLVCSMALGYADDGAIVNTYRTPREPLARFCQWWS